MATARAQAAADKRRADPRRRGARVRPPGLPHLPRVGHRRRGGRRLRPRLPLLPLQGRGAQHAVPRALGRHARGDRARSTARRSRRARSSHAIASFIVDSYRHDPELMKVIIVEVTRAANSFGATHLAKIREAYELIAGIVAHGPGRRRVHATVTAAVRRDGVLRRDRAGAHRLDLRAAARPSEATSSRPRASSSRRSAAGSSRSPTPAVQRLECAADGQRRRQAPDVVRPAGRARRAGEHRHDPRWPP